MSRAEAKIREKAIHKEKLWQERIRTEEEARLKVEMAERALPETIETEKKAAKEPTAKCASGTLNMAHNAGKLSKEAPRLLISTFDVKKGIQSSVRNIIQASENALESEKRRQQVYEELSAEVKIQKRVLIRAEELAKLINSPNCPQSISIKSFVEKIVSRFSMDRGLRMTFAASRVAVLVISKEAFRTKDDYFKALHCTEVDGKIEGFSDYVERLRILRCYMKLYRALLLVQAEVGGYRQGLTEGWAWLARFLNTLPANLFTANALVSFLEVAGYALHRQYKNQFEKLLRVIAREFLTALRNGDNADEITEVKSSIQDYVDMKSYEKTPDGFNLRTRLDSNKHVMTEEEYRLNYMCHASISVRA